MEKGPWFIVPSDGLEKPGIEPAIPGLQRECHNHCTTEASFANLYLFKSSEHIYEKGDGPYCGFGYLSLFSDTLGNTEPKKITVILHFSTA